jgi:hypothetical protein
MPVERGHLGQDHLIKTAGTGQSLQAGPTGSLERTEMTGLPGHDSGVRRAVGNAAWTGQLEH